MITISFDEYGRFEEKELKNSPISMIAGFLYDDKDVQGERESELIRINKYLIEVCSAAGGNFPDSLHFNRSNKNGRSAAAEDAFSKTLAEFLKKGTYNRKQLTDKERKGEYYPFCYIKTKAGKTEILPGYADDTHGDTSLSNLYIRMANDVISRMIFNNPVINNIKKVYFDLPTRSYSLDSIPEEDKKRYKAQGYSVKNQHNKDMVYLTGLDSFRSAIEREMYHSVYATPDIEAIDVRPIRYEYNNTFGTEEAVKDGFLYMADMLCAVIHRDSSGRDITLSSISKIPARVESISGSKSLSFFYDKTDEYYAKAYDCIRKKKYTLALEYIYDGTEFKSECRDIYRQKWFALLLDMLKKDVEPKAYADAVSDFNVLSRSNNLEQNKLVFVAKKLEEMMEGIQFDKDDQKAVLFDFYQTAATAYNHIAKTKEARRCIKKADEYAGYVSLETRLDMRNKEVVSLCDSLDFSMAVLSAGKLHKVWDAVMDLRERSFGEKDISSGARRAYSQLGQIYAFAGDPRAEMCFDRAIRPGRDADSLISMSFLLHYYADQCMKKKYDAKMKEYCDGKEDLNEQLEYIVKEGAKGRNALISMKFALYVFVRGAYLFHMEEISKDKVIRNRLLKLDESIVSISPGAADQINGHPWEIIYKYIAFIAKECKEEKTARDYMDKTEKILKKDASDPDPLLKAIIMYGKLEFVRMNDKRASAQINKLIFQCWNAIKEVNPDVYGQYKDAETRNYENLSMLMSYMYH